VVPLGGFWGRQGGGKGGNPPRGGPPAGRKGGRGRKNKKPFAHPQNFFTGGRVPRKKRAHNHRGPKKGQTRGGKPRGVFVGDFDKKTRVGNWGAGWGRRNIKVSESTFSRKKKGGGGGGGGAPAPFQKGKF